MFHVKQFENGDVQKNQIIEQREELLGSFLMFVQVFYKLRTGRDFVISTPIGRESHHLIISRQLTYTLRNPSDNRLIINIPPGHGKSELARHFVCWAMAHYPDSNFLYVSYGYERAVENTYIIKQIMEMPIYRTLFNIWIKQDSSAKDNFTNNCGGKVQAFGSSGPITGCDAGLPGLDRFTGAIIMDDMHKPDEVHSDTLRTKVIDNFNQTLKMRPRSDKVPLIFIGQVLREDDLSDYLKKGNDGYEWRQIVLPALDTHDHALDENVKSAAAWKIERDINKYVFWAQGQQTPLPPGGSIFSKDDFVILDKEPDIFATFITCDTAETEKTYNDATVFSFWGLYYIREIGVEIPRLALHWLDCNEIRIEPKFLESEFRQFYSDCLRHRVKPHLAAIEKKSTGVTLLSVLSNFRGMEILDIERTRASGSKTNRYLEIQPLQAAKLISFTQNAKHIKMCIEHCAKITANNSHRHDDIADTLYDAAKIGLINQYITHSSHNPKHDAELIKTANFLMSPMKKIQEARRKANASRF